MEQVIDIPWYTEYARVMKGCHVIWILLITLAGSLCCIRPLCAQTADALIRKGNREYQDKNYSAAEATYLKASASKKSASISLFNLGNSLYRQNRFQEARSNYEKSLKASRDSLGEARIQYNIGNTFMKKKDWQNSIQSYEKSLLQNPKDDQARYNLAYAQAMLKKQQSGGGGKNNKNQNQNNKNNQDQKNQQNKQNNQNNQNKNQQPPQNSNNQQQKNQDQSQDQPNSMSKQEAQNLLNALDQQEQKILQKKDQKHGTPVTTEKDW